MATLKLRVVTLNVAVWAWNLTCNCFKKGMAGCSSISTLLIILFTFFDKKPSSFPSKFILGKLDGRESEKGDEEPTDLGSWRVGRGGGGVLVIVRSVIKGEDSEFDESSNVLFLFSFSMIFLFLLGGVTSSFFPIGSDRFFPVILSSFSFLLFLFLLSPIFGINFVHGRGGSGGGRAKSALVFTDLCFALELEFGILYFGSRVGDFDFSLDLCIRVFSFSFPLVFEKDEVEVVVVVDDLFFSEFELDLVLFGGLDCRVSLLGSRGGIVGFILTRWNGLWGLRNTGCGFFVFRRLVEAMDEGESKSLWRFVNLCASNRILFVNMCEGRKVGRQKKNELYRGGIAVNRWGFPGMFMRDFEKFNAFF